MNMVIKREKQAPFYKMKQAHFHESHEIYYLFSGKRRFFIDDSIYNISRGDLVLIKRGVIHRTTYITDKMHERIYIRFSDEMLEPLYDAFGSQYINDCFLKPIFTIPQNRIEYMELLFKKMESDFYNGDMYSEFALRNCLYEIFIFLLRYKKYVSNFDDEINEADEIMQRAARYIIKNYSSNITLDFISEYSGISSSYFSKKFKQVTGFGFKEFITGVRIKRACELLIESEKSITDIAFECGFNDSNYFGDTFKKVKGVSPANYRKRI